MSLSQRIALIIIFAVGIISRADAEPRKMHILWFMHKDHDFWEISRSVAEDAAKDLGIEASFILTPDTEGNQRFTAYKFANEALDKLIQKPDTDYYLAMIGGTFGVEKVLQKANEKGIKVFFYNTKPEGNLEYRLNPFPTLIGGLIPDDKNAGYLEAQQLIRAAKAANSSLPIHVIGIGGWSRDTVDTERRAGLERAIKEEAAVLDQYFYSRWSTDVAKDVIVRSRKTYPKTKVFWNIADYLAISALEVLETEKEQFFVGGVDWTNQALLSLQKDSGLTVSVGGHFLDTGWASVILYDYHQKLDFKNIYPSLLIDSNMSKLDRTTAKSLLQKFPGNDWTRIDFKSFTRTQTKANTYDFSLEALLKH